MPGLHQASSRPRALGRQATPLRLCAICVKRAACAIDDVDSRRVPVCMDCRDTEVPEPPPAPTTRERLVRVLARAPHGLQIIELAQALGEDDEVGRAKLSAALGRAIRAGLVDYVGGWNDRTYYLLESAPSLESRTAAQLVSARGA